jgi:hypothetical protein
MSFCIVYDISVSLHVKLIVSRRIQLRSRNICFIYLLRWKCHFRWWRIKAIDLNKFPNSQIVRTLLEFYPTCMWSEKLFIEILAAIFVNHVTFANWCKTLLHFIWLPFSYNLAKSNTFYHRKLQNQIDKLRLPPLRQPVRTQVLLADSKGFNLQQQVKVNPESFIQFWCKSSATAENRLQYLQDNLESELNTLHNITLCLGRHM